MDSTKWYTGTGDDGFTGVLGRERVPKYALRPEAYGTVDEASAFLGMARARAQAPGVAITVLQVQRDLYMMMADLATLPETATREPWLKEDRLDWLEEQTEAFGQQVELPKAFIVPGDSQSGACLEICRTVVRRAERLVARLSHEGELRNDAPLKYLNRLSSLLFVLGRVEDKAAGVEHFTLARGD
ncbi:MAG: cob(I)yrinic acid a,c-diamide adenosyltransferase [Nitrososphaerales archaeon]